MLRGTVLHLRREVLLARGRNHRGAERGGDARPMGVPDRAVRGHRPGRPPLDGALPHGQRGVFDTGEAEDPIRDTVPSLYVNSANDPVLSEYLAE